MSQSFAADDFDAIRRRLEELRAARTRELTAQPRESPPRGPRPYHTRTDGGNQSARHRDFPGSDRGRDGPSPPMTLRAACKLAGYDRAGSRCAKCRLVMHCRDDSRWLVGERSRSV